MYNEIAATCMNLAPGQGQSHLLIKVLELTQILAIPKYGSTSSTHEERTWLYSRPNLVFIDA